MKNKIAIITGASSGIGKAIAHQLIEAGAIVVNADVHPPNHVAANNYYFIQTDLTLKEEVLHLFDEVAKLGVPHILICNAGKGVHEKLAEGDPEKWQSVININLMGTLRFLRAFLPSMVKKGMVISFLSLLLPPTRPMPSEAFMRHQKQQWMQLLQH
jgi:NAD(P)-dependent dehydrogenase (short-subunit alcohol dehydrogenase family)